MSDARAERVRECLDRDVPLTRALVADLLAAYDECMPQVAECPDQMCHLWPKPHPLTPSCRRMHDLTATHPSGHRLVGSAMLLDGGIALIPFGAPSLPSVFLPFDEGWLASSAPNES